MEKKNLKTEIEIGGTNNFITLGKKNLETEIETGGTNNFMTLGKKKSRNRD